MPRRSAASASSSEILGAMDAGGAATAIWRWRAELRLLKGPQMANVRPSPCMFTKNVFPSGAKVGPANSESLFALRAKTYTLFLEQEYAFPRKALGTQMPVEEGGYLRVGVETVL